jgi:hypothetical protein
MSSMNSRTNDNRCRLVREEAQMLDSFQTTGVMVIVEIIYAIIVQCVGIWFLYAYSRVNLRPRPGSTFHILPVPGVALRGPPATVCDRCRGRRWLVPAPAEFTRWSA